MFYILEEQSFFAATWVVLFTQIYDGCSGYRVLIAIHEHLGNISAGRVKSEFSIYIFGVFSFCLLGAGKPRGKLERELFLVPIWLLPYLNLSPSLSIPFLFRSFPFSL